MFGLSKIHNRNVPDWPIILAAHTKNAKDQRLKDFYSASITDKKLPLEKVPFVALDFETTGLDPQRDDIISIGLASFDLCSIYCGKALHWLVNPRQPLGENSIIFHKITHSDIDKAPDLNNVLEEVLSALAGKMIVVHCSRIERTFLDSALKIRLGEGIRFPVIDTMAIEIATQRRMIGNIWKQLRGKKQLSVRLSDSRERYGLPAYQSHHALTDAIATAELFQAQVAYYYSKRTTLGELWV